LRCEQFFYQPSPPGPLASGDLARTEEDTAPVRIDFNERIAIRLWGPTRLVPQRRAASDVSGAGGNRPPLLRQLERDRAALRCRFQAAGGFPGWEHFDLGPERANPAYRPEPKPLSERSPWLVYLVLIAACGALAGILVNLAKASARVAVS
jgi:hypothetical protein